MPILVESRQVKSFTFPGGEVQVTGVEATSRQQFLTAHIQNSDDVMALLLATDALKRQGAREITLQLPYVPYARQDRVCNPGEAHALKVFATLINSQGYKNVIVLDPHSDVTEALFDNLAIVKNHKFVTDVVVNQLGLQSFYLVSPDAGSAKKISELAAFLIKQGITDFEVIQCGKVRDTKTGKLTAFTVPDIDTDRACLIVDDIIDGGGTFLGLADAFKQQGANDLYLAATHGIFSQGFDKLAAAFTAVIATNSFKDFDNLPENVRILNWKG